MSRLRMMSVEALPDFRLRLRVSDGRVIDRALAAELAHPDGPMVRPLRNPAYFAQVRIDPELETVVWPNGFDIDPDWLLRGHV